MLWLVALLERRSQMRLTTNKNVFCCFTLIFQVVSIVWVDEDKAFNIGIKSVLDGKPMDGISSLRIHSGPDMTQVIDLTTIYNQ